MSMRDAYREEIEARLQEQKARLALLKARASRAAARGKILACEEFANADKSIAEARAKLKSLAGAGGGALSELKTGISRAYADLKAASQRAAEHLRANVAAPPPPAPQSGAKSKPRRTLANKRRAAPAVRATARRAK